jgi:cytochrome c-type biogenesis protein CcmE
MTRKRRRLALIGGGLFVLAIAVGLILNAFRESIVFFNLPSAALTSTARPHASLGAAA